MKVLFTLPFWVPLQKIRAFYKIVENLHNKVIWVINWGVKITFKGKNNSLKVRDGNFCNTTRFFSNNNL
jgi:hypothetical protein